MANSKNTKIATIITALLLTLTAIMVGLPTAVAQPPRKPTYAFIGAMPNPVQVNTEVLLHIGITDATPNVAIGWEGLTVAVTKPDGTTETLGPYTTDATGGTGVTYVPTQIGTYTLQMNFPEQLLMGFTIWMPNGTVMEASSSDPLQLIVQEDPIGIWPGVALPTEFWSRPVSAQFWEWADITGNWQTIPPNRFAPHNEDAPNTAHILWTKQIDAGGLAGGNLGNRGMEMGDAYEGKFYDSVVLNGVLYYNKYGYALFRGPMGPQAGIYAVDLHTGEELWFKNNTFINLGQLFYWSSYNYHGTFPYLWEVRGNTWIAYDAFTGDWAYTITDVPATVTGLYGGLGANTVLGPRNEIYAYTINNAENWMTCWNSSRVVIDAGSWGNSIVDGGRMFAGERGIEWNVTIPVGLPGVINHVLEDRIIGSDVPAWTGLADDPITFWGLSIKPGQEGQLLFKKTWTPPPGRLIMLPGPASLEDGVFIVTAKDTTSLYGFSTDTGNQVWGPTESQPYIDAYTLGEERAIPRAVAFAYGKLYSTGMAGVLYCYDAKTANLLWKYTAEDKYAEMLWSNNWPLRINFITDGKLYLSHDEHSPLDPMARGAPFIVLDAETGEEVWTIDGAFRTTEWGGSAVIGDSIMSLYNSYDQRIYAVGKGPSKTTVSAPDAGIPQGCSVVISGYVTDVSPGTASPEIALRFPNGVAAVADQSISDWMKYVYMQYPFPVPHVYGVDVTVDVVDANGNFRNIGTAQTDASGFYSLEWKPDIYGKYTVIATFPGSEAYYASYDAAAFVVDQAPDPTPPPEPTPPPTTDATLMGLGVGAIIAIIVMGLVIIILVRKR